MHVNIFVFLQILLSLSQYFAQIQLNTPTVQCNQKELHLFYQLKTENLCFQIIIDSNDTPIDTNTISCVIQQLQELNTSITIRGLSDLLLFNIDRTNQPMECRKYYFIFAENYELFLNQLLLLEATNTESNKSKHFIPFTDIWFSGFRPPMWSMAHINYINDNVLNVLWLERSGAINGIEYFTAIHNIFTNSTVQLQDKFNQNDFDGFLNEYRDHPFLRNSPEHVFQVSLFDCSPYVIYINREDKRFSGLEYRFITEITKQWKFEVMAIENFTNAWQLVTKCLRQDPPCDFAMCSIWVALSRYQQFDMTNYFDYQRGSFLVPKPVILNAASVIYLSFTNPVWIAVVTSFFGIVICVIGLSRVGAPNHAVINRTDGKTPKSVYADISLSVLDVIGIAVGHGIIKFPRELSVKCILTSWIVISMLLGVIYCTGYSSLLTSPRYTKPINTMDQFLSEGYRWGVIGNNNDVIFDLKGSRVENYKRLLSLVNLEGSYQERARNIRDFERRYAVLVKITFNSFLGSVEYYWDEALSLRLMKSSFFNHYTAFALRKHSPYLGYINLKLRRFQESGILYHWSTDAEIPGAKRMRQFFTKTTQDHQEQSRRLALSRISGSFYMLFVGLAAGVVTFICEQFW